MTDNTNDWTTTYSNLISLVDVRIAIIFDELYGHGRLYICIYSVLHYIDII